MSSGIAIPYIFENKSLLNGKQVLTTIKNINIFF